MSYQYTSIQTYTLSVTVCPQFQCQIIITQFDPICEVRVVVQGIKSDTNRYVVLISRDQPNSRFHGRDIFVKLAFFRENCQFPWNPWLFVNFNAYTFIYEGLKSFGAPQRQRLATANLASQTIIAKNSKTGIAREAKTNRDALTLDCVESWVDLVFIYVGPSKYLFIWNFKCIIPQFS